MRVIRLTMTYLQRVQLAPYNHVDTGVVVEVEPDPEDSLDALRDLASLIAATWDVVGPATQLQVRTAVTEFDELQDDRRRRLSSGEVPIRNGASHTPTEPQPATAKQRETITGLKVGLNWDDDDLTTFAHGVGVDLARMTRGEAQALTQAMHQQPPKPRQARPPALSELSLTTTPPSIPAAAPPESEPPFPRAPAPEPEEAPTPSAGPPTTVAEAERRFYIRYGDVIRGKGIPLIRQFLEEPGYPKPQSIEDWIATAEAVRAKARALAGAATAD